jgi:hypothetical protein
METARKTVPEILPTMVIANLIISFLQQILQSLKADKLVELPDLINNTLIWVQPGIRTISMEKEVLETLQKLLKPLLKPVRVELEEDKLTKLDEGLYARKTADGKIEIFEVIE